MTMSTDPRRNAASRRRAWLLALPFLACSDGDEGLDPALRAPQTGVYAYEALVYTADTLPPDTFSGQLDISVATQDSLVGTWSVPGYLTAPVRGTWNINAYTLPALPSSIPGTITHRVWRQSASLDLSCALTYEHVVMPADTFRSSVTNHCTLLHCAGDCPDGAARPGWPAGAAHVMTRRPAAPAMSNEP